MRALRPLERALGVGAFAWAAVAGRTGVAPPGVLSSQAMVAAIVAGLVAALRGGGPALWRTRLRGAAVAGVLAATGLAVVGFAALAHLPAGMIGVVAAASPVLTHAIALSRRDQDLQPLRAVAMALGLAVVLAGTLPRSTLDVLGALPGAAAATLAPPASMHEGASRPTRGTDAAGTTATPELVLPTCRLGRPHAKDRP